MPAIITSHRRTTPHSKRLLLLVAALAVALAGGLAVAPVVLARTASVTTLTPARTIELGQTTTVTGKVVAGSTPGMGALVLQSWNGRTWVNAQVKPLWRNGTFTYTVGPRQTVKLRATYGGTAFATSSVSAPITITVRDPAAARGDSIVAEAAKHLGKPYRYGGAGPNSFDCSGFTMYVLGKFGKKLPHSATKQAAYGTSVSKSAAKPGDLVFFPSGGRMYHTGIYAGNGYMYDSSTYGKPVSKRKIWTSAYVVRRLV